MNEFNDSEFIEICRKFKVKPDIKEITLKDITENYFNKVRDAVNSDRRGEVVFCVIRPNGKVISVTCEEYPEGIFRIPTGGIGHDEDIVEAVIRETKEELGLDVEILSFGGVLKICLEFDKNHVMFYSYLFILKEMGGRLLEDASDDEISEVREASLEELGCMVENLNYIEGKWRSWGKFRYESSKAIYEYLKNNPSLRV